MTTIRSLLFHYAATLGSCGDLASLLGGVARIFSSEKKKIKSDTEENPSGEDMSDDVHIRACGTFFFRFKPSNDVQGVIICKQCFGIVAALQGNSMDLYNHLKRHHKIQYELAMKDKQTTSQKPTCKTTQTSVTQKLYSTSSYALYD